MSLLSRPGIVLVEIAIAAGLVAVAFEGPWLPIGAAVAAICALLALVPVRGKPLFRVVASWLAMRARASRLRGEGVAALVGPGHQVVGVPTAGTVGIGAIRDATTWSVPLSLPLSGVLNDDAPIPLDRLATLLRIEDVPLASVRLVTMLAPSPAAGTAPSLPRLATRHLVLTLDTVKAADAIVRRGGQPGIHQILRRCVLRAEEVLSTAGVDVRRLSERAVAADSANALGPLAAAGQTPPPKAVESFSGVTLQDVVSRTWAVSGADSLPALDRIAAQLPVPIVATSVVLTPGPREDACDLTLLLRMSGSSSTIRDAGTTLRETTRGLDVRLHPMPGEQVPLLRATTLLGAASAA